MADASPEFAAAVERELPVAENPDESARLKSFLAALLECAAPAAERPLIPNP